MIRRNIKDKINIKTEVENGYEYAILYKLSEVKIISKADFCEIGTDDEIKEIIFFNKSKELRIFDYNGEKRAAVIEDENDAEKNIKPIKRKIISGFGYEHLYIKEYVLYDEDGQAYVDAVRICGIE
ncbi:MAG: hypothetical protein ACI4VF_06120 [Lachnospirales bacterium]